MSRVLHIFVAGDRGAPMQSVQSVEAVAGTGLVGDRYAVARNRRAWNCELSLIEIENIRAFVETTGFELPADAPRRNIVTEGVRLNELRGRRFYIGAVLVEGIERCEPCVKFKKRTHPEALRFFRGKGGLCTRILAGGTLAVGDAIRVER